jgi:hypothetical protein
MSVTKSLSVPKHWKRSDFVGPLVDAAQIFAFSQIARNLYPFEHSNVQLAGKRS